MMVRMRPINSRNGMTLVELVVVVMVISLMMESRFANKWSRDALC